MEGRRLGLRGTPVGSCLLTRLNQGCLTRLWPTEGDVLSHSQLPAGSRCGNWAPTSLLRRELGTPACMRGLGKLRPAVVQCATAGPVSLETPRASGPDTGGHAFPGGSSSPHLAAITRWDWRAPDPVRTRGEDPRPVHSSFGILMTFHRETLPISFICNKIYGEHLQAAHVFVKFRSYSSM